MEDATDRERVNIERRIAEVEAQRKARSEKLERGLGCTRETILP